MSKFTVCPQRHDVNNPGNIRSNCFAINVDRSFLERVRPINSFVFRLARKAYPVVPGSHALLTSTGLAAGLGSAGIALESTK